MKRIFRYLAVFFGALLLSACALLADKQASQDAVGATDGSVAQPNVVVEKSSQVPELPNIELDKDLLYILLTAEIAGHRGDIELATTQYTEAARLTRDPRIIERAIRVANYAKHYQQGLEVARIWVEIAPDSIKARRSLAILLLRTGNKDAALEEFDYIVSSQKASQGIFSVLVKQLAREADREAVLDVIQRLAKRYRHVAAAHYALAAAAEQAGKFNLAESAVRQALTLKPDWVDAHNQLARVLHLQGNTKAATAYLEKVLSDTPDNRVLRMSYARMLVDAKQMKKAREQFEILASQAPGNEDILFALGILALQAEDYDSAERYLTGLTGKGKRSLNAAYYLGQIAEQRKQPFKAIRWYAEVHHGEYAFDAKMRIVALMAKQGNIESALKRLHAISIRGEAQQVRIYLVEGEVLRDADRYQDAMTLFNTALESLPGNNDLLYARALMAERIDRLDILMRDLLAVLDKEPDNAHALNALGYTLADRTSRFKEASKYIHRAYELLPNDAAIIDSMGWLQYRLGNHEEALKHLTRAYDLNDDAEIAAHLGEVLWVMGEHQRARKVWNRGLEEAPKDKKLLEVIQRFDQ